jgi:hypothetical protein
MVAFSVATVVVAPATKRINNATMPIRDFNMPFLPYVPG